VASLYIPGAYGQGLASAFTTTFQGLGGEVSLERELVEEKPTYNDYVVDLEAVFPNPGTGPDAIMLVAFPADAVKILKAYNQFFAAQHPVTWLFNDSEISTDFAVDAVDVAGFDSPHEGTVPAQRPSNPRFESFATAYHDRFGTEPDDAFSGHTYDSLFLTAMAIEAAGSLDGAAIRDQMQAVSSGGTAYEPSTIQGAFEAIRAHQDVNYEGASGSVDLDANGDVTNGLYDIWTINLSTKVIERPLTNCDALTTVCQ
jgi:branched-chain amino acid transport system substrate-binding protein